MATEVHNLDRFFSLSMGFGCIIRHHMLSQSCLSERKGTRKKKKRVPNAQLIPFQTPTAIAKTAHSPHCCHSSISTSVYIPLSSYIELTSSSRDTLHVSFSILSGVSMLNTAAHTSIASKKNNFVGLWQCQ